VNNPFSTVNLFWLKSHDPQHDKWVNSPEAHGIYKPMIFQPLTSPISTRSLLANVVNVLCFLWMKQLIVSPIVGVSGQNPTNLLYPSVL
jgi:hypothetical protein